MLKNGRISYWDPQNDAYNLSIVAPKLANRPLNELFRVRRYRSWWWGHHTDSDMAVSYALLHYLSIDPPTTHPVHGPMMNATALHHRIRQQDAKDNRIYPSGCTLLAGCKVAKTIGWIPEYYWATSLLAALNYLHDIGPLLVSSKWYDSLLVRNPRSIARITADAKEVQGSVYCVTGIFPKSGLVRIAQTWGDGYYFLAFHDFSRLISEGGEVACLRGLPASS